MGGGYNPLSRTLSALMVIFIAFFVFTPFVHAAFGSGNIMCSTPPHIGPCPFNMPCPKAPILGVIGKPCQETANGKTCTGKCIAVGICKAAGCDGIGGGSEAAGIGKALEAAMGMLKDLLKPKGGGGGAPPPGGAGGMSPTGPLYPTCVHNSATKTVAPIPCTEANGQINYGGTSFADGGLDSSLTGGGALGNSTSEALLNILNGTTNDSNSNTNTNTNTTETETEDSSTSDTSTTSAKQTKVVVEGEGSLQPTGQKQEGVLQGDIVVGGSGGILYARSRDLESNTEVAGFYGGSTGGQIQPSGLIGRMCASRPWGDGVLGGFIKGTFFDGLCKRFGYQVGTVAAPSHSGGKSGAKRPAISITQNPVRPATTSVAIQPEVDIWATPAKVRLGTRTYIFWNSRDVESCTERGPSFEHNTLSGGASTVPLSDTSIFTIECKTIDGRTLTDSVRVTISL